QAEDGIRDKLVTGVQTCALPICAVIVLTAFSAVAARAGVVVVLLAGPLLAALVHSAVTVTRTGNLAFADGVEGLRLHWRRGLLRSEERRVGKAWRCVWATERHND